MKKLYMAIMITGIITGLLMIGALITSDTLQMIFITLEFTTSLTFTTLIIIYFAKIYFKDKKNANNK